LQKTQFRTLATGALAALTLLSAVGCGQTAANKPAVGGTGAPTPQYAGRTLNIMVNGGYYLDTLKKYVITPYEQKTGVKVQVTEATSVQMVNRLRTEKAAPSVDLVSIAEVAAVPARAEGLFEKIDPSKIPNLADVAPAFKNKDGFGIQSVISPIVIVYNKDKVKTAPTAWADFWNPAYKGKVVIADIDNTMGPMLLATAARINGGSETNIDPGFAKMKELKANLSYIYKGEGQEVPQALAQGDIWVSHMMLVKAMDLVKNNAPVGIVIPKEGAHPLPFTLELVKGSKNADIASLFLDQALSIEAQEGFAKDMYVTPSNTKAKIEGDLAKVLPRPDQILNLDWAAIAKDRAAWTERWKKEITQ
jgi:putative spermidine/putrescine transport system substrate-binding protein